MEARPTATVTAVLAGTKVATQVELVGFCRKPVEVDSYVIDFGDTVVIIPADIIETAVDEMKKLRRRRGTVYANKL